jgi:hypothetical protein
VVRDEKGVATTLKDAAKLAISYSNGSYPRCIMISVQILSSVEGDATDCNITRVSFKIKGSK